LRGANGGFFVFGVGFTEAFSLSTSSFKDVAAAEAVSEEEEAALADFESWLVVLLGTFAAVFWSTSGLAGAHWAHRAMWSQGSDWTAGGHCKHLRHRAARHPGRTLAETGASSSSSTLTL
jgi:hypothetical protein